MLKRSSFLSLFALSTCIGTVQSGDLGGGTSLQRAQPVRIALEDPEGTGDFSAELVSRDAVLDVLMVDNTMNGGSYSGTISAGQFRFAYTDTDGVRGAGQFGNDRFFTFCGELQAIRSGDRVYELIAVHDGPNPTVGNGEGPYDLLDAAELNAVVAAAMRLGWVNDDLGQNAMSTNERLAAIQIAIWRVLWDNSQLTIQDSDVEALVFEVEAEAANEPNAMVNGLVLMSNPNTQDMLYILRDDLPPSLVCVADVLVDSADCPCDLNLDGMTDTLDTMAFADAYGMGDADFNGDGVTDYQDLLDFLACYFDPTGNCGLTFGEGDCCVDSEGDRVDLSTIRMQYTGEGCDSSSNMQDEGKFECDGDPLQDDEVYILATDKDEFDDDDAKVWFEGVVQLGETFDISSFNAGRDELRNETFIYIFADAGASEPIQSVEFHTSCSQPIFAGDTFGASRVIACFDENGNPTGDTQGDDGSNGVEVSVIQVSFSASDDIDDPSDILFDAYIETECEQIPVSNGEIIEMRCFENVDQTSEDLCEQDLGKPAAITLVYTGDNCDATNTAQDSGKWSCVGDPMMAPEVYILVSDEEDPDDQGDAGIYFEGMVALGESFEAEAENAGEDKFRSQTFVFVYADSTRSTLLQSIEFHTSCSQPIRLGDQYGSIRITGVTSTDGDFIGGSGLECMSEIIDGRLVITASSARLVVIAVDTAGNEVVCEQIICEPSEDVGDGEDCCADGNKPEALELRYTGESCDATVTSQDEDKYSCEGDPMFASEVYIIASDEEDPFGDHEEVYFAGVVGLDESFIISAEMGGRDNFRSRTYVHAYDMIGGDLLQTIEFHTSCSQPLFTGDQYGSILIVDCFVDDPAGGESCCEDGDKPSELDLTYTGMDCASSMNTQDPGKFECSGDPAGEAQVFIVVSDDEDPDADDADVYFMGGVDLNETFTVAASQIGRDRFRSETHVYVYSADGMTLLQAVEFHTSCSQPLELGDTFGSLMLVGCRSN